MHKYEKNLKYNMPDKNGFFGEFGGCFVSDELKEILTQLSNDFETAFNDDNFLNEVYSTLTSMSCRPTPVYLLKI